MIRDPDLAALRTELERLGHVVAPHGDHICVRLPMFTSVRVRNEGGRLSCQPLFGPVPRNRAFALSLAALTGVVGGLFYGTGISPAALTVAFGGAMAGLLTACRFVLTETCVQRVQTLWAASRARAELPRGVAPDNALGPATLEWTPEQQRSAVRGQAGTRG